MQQKVAIVIPFYKPTLSSFEQIALQQCQSILAKYPKIAVKPAGMPLPEHREIISLSETISFDDAYFTSVWDYNRLMLSAEFYQKFLGYNYILIYQMDAFVFKDELNYWCEQGFDYIGAPWIRKTYDKSTIGMLWLNLRLKFRKIFPKPKSNYIDNDTILNKVGNGGFSLRRTSAFYDICTNSTDDIAYYLSQKNHFYNEDVFWSIEVNRFENKLKIPDKDMALKFAFEVPAVKARLLSDEELPFGCHDWDKYASYWRPIFKRFGFVI